MHGFIFYKIIRILECFHRRKVSVHLKQNRNGGRGGGGSIPQVLIRRVLHVFGN